MKNNVLGGFILLVLFGMMLGSSCNPKSKELKEVAKIENTLKSVSILYDSVGVNPADLWAIFEKTNKAIDSIGYPDAGYKLWVIQNDSVKDLRFLLEGYWPDQAVYDSIHKNKLYLNSWRQEDEKFFKKLKTISYHRFSLVK